MNAPENLSAIAVDYLIPIASVQASRTNPRKSFDEAAMAELTESVRQHGVLQPILVRRKPDDSASYELVAGERRYRAAKAAGLDQIPAMVRNLSDAAALELQVIENLQRADLHPLEEAEGYEQLMKLHHYTAEELSTKVGKSKAYVYARLKLLALAPKAREAFYAGKLSASIALLVARIPVPDLQAKAVKELITPRYHGAEPMSYRDAAGYLQREYMLRLKEAPFDICSTTLLAKVGACGECPKRTGNQPELFGDVKDADVCTDPTCFGAKRDAHFKLVRADAEANNRKVIAGAAAKKLFPYEHSRPNGYIPANDTVSYDSQKKASTFAKQVGIEPVLIEKPKSGELIEAYDETALKAAMRKAGLLKGQSARSQADLESNRAQKLKVKIDQEYRKRVFAQLRSVLTVKTTVTTEDGVLVALTLWERADFAAKRDLVELYGWDPKPHGAVMGRHQHGEEAHRRVDDHPVVEADDRTIDDRKYHQLRRPLR
jgi:ParB/RepB/Spo0J family partition protein